MSLTVLACFRESIFILQWHKSFKNKMPPPGHVSSRDGRGCAVRKRDGLLPAGLRGTHQTPQPRAQSSQRGKILPGGAAGIQVRKEKRFLKSRSVLEMMSLSKLYGKMSEGSLLCR